MSVKKEREIWIDNVKVIACFFVVLGHFFQGLVTSNIIIASDVFNWFIQTIYCFHVPLFFICSGYLYQRYSVVNDFSSYKNNISKKLLDLGIPFIVFTIFKWATKNLLSFQGDTEKMPSLFNSLFVDTLPPYWFLLCLLIIFFLTPTFEKPIMKIIFLILALTMKLCVDFFGFTNIYILNQFLNNYFWFVLGMILSDYGLNKVFKNKFTLPLAISIFAIFTICSILVYKFNIKHEFIFFLIGFLACASVICIIGSLYANNKQTKLFGIFAKYTMPVFLMHTIFAAPFRTVLLKLSIQSPVIHIIFGLIVSFVGPVIAAIIMNKTIFLEFFIYPRKAIRRIGRLDSE